MIEESNLEEYYSFYYFNILDHDKKKVKTRAIT